ncbi:2-keto-gluconate dehydrogenase [Lasiodiplodia theobromae]|uniref:2-keto-gluconate dehydrogenase n=1 Tax=Lasiodiplodia theobromae TaxID=45133 RepID=A0A8H7IQR7_9PEZI|nr:2-keto-gluconate dehydrogenase [Lasiodiplodia theobromae]
MAPFGIPNFYDRVGHPPQNYTQQPKKTGGGFPVPGKQDPSASWVMTNHYFVSHEKWSTIVKDEEFDYIVVGSGCTALAFISETLRIDPKKRILCLERGDFWLPSHFQNLPLPFKVVLGGVSETFPWTLSEKTFKDPLLGYCHGSCPFFGGRSAFWSAWSPQPRIEDMRGFPESMIKATQEAIFWPEAKRLLNVTSASDVDDTIFAGLQDVIDERLREPGDRIPTATVSEPAQLSVGRRSPTSTLRFNKFSVPGPLLRIKEEQAAKEKEGTGARLDIALGCVVEKLRADDGMVRSIETSLGPISWANDNTKVVLCAGAFPAATLLLNSFDSCAKTVGKRVTGHFQTQITARVPLSTFGPWSPAIAKSDQPCKLEIAAHYLAGEDADTKQQYHVQVTAIHSPNPTEDAEDAARECPDYAAAATEAQLRDSTEHVVFVCATLGEFSEHNPHSWFRRDEQNQDVTTNVKLQYTLTDADRKLWDLMDEATYQTIETMSGPAPKGKDLGLEYWHDGPTGGSGFWSRERPENVRVPGIVHEASTAFVGGEEAGGSVDALGRPHGVQNVFVTGGALFPTAGSWNPTLTMCGFAQHLARELNVDTIT